jgi:two-component system chemotaxis response regulator CheY
MKILIVDDDFTSRRILLKYLSEYGTCDVAVDGKEAVEAFKMALDEDDSYDLVFLDIMMPELNGQEALKQIRQIEIQNGKFDLDGAKVIMTTSMDDAENIKTAFREQCEGYIVKPVDKVKLISKLTKLELINP